MGSALANSYEEAGSLYSAMPGSLPSRLPDAIPPEWGRSQGKTESAGRSRGLTDFLIRRIPALSPAARLALARRFDREEELLELSPIEVFQISEKTTAPRWTWDEVRRQAESDERILRMRGLSAVSFAEPHYPPQLREVYDPPILLFYQGTLPNPICPLAGVVGTRRPTPAAADAAFRLAKELSEGGIPVVSGLALGVDALAHRGCLAGPSPTIAVLGSGIDSVYPASNRPLARRILERGGLIASEYPPGTLPQKWQFPERNRVITALSRGILVVEAPEKSGALITARCALEQNRDLYVAAAGRSALGTARLVVDGAPLIERAAQILADWGLPLPSTPVHPPSHLDHPSIDAGAGTFLASALSKELGLG